MQAVAFTPYPVHLEIVHLECHRRRGVQLILDAHELIGSRRERIRIGKCLDPGHAIRRLLRIHRHRHTEDAPGIAPVTRSDQSVGRAHPQGVTGRGEREHAQVRPQCHRGVCQVLKVADRSPRETVIVGNEESVVAGGIDAPGLEREIIDALADQRLLERLASVPRDCDAKASGLAGLARIPRSHPDRISSGLLLLLDRDDPASRQSVGATVGVDPRP